jgi:GTP-binding protein
MVQGGLLDNCCFYVILGKTTLVDCLLRQTGAVSSEASNVRSMDSNTLEQERGITILSKCTSLTYKGYHINVVDTPGHADFGGEVERALSLVDGVLLIVDATEGPMPQTRFVLSKALSRNLKPIVVFNKVDRDSVRPDEVDSEVLDLFMSLDASDAQLEYPLVYASGKEGWASIRGPKKPEGNVQDMQALLDLVISFVPPPLSDAKPSSPFAMLVNSLEKNNFLGRCLLGKVTGSSLQLNDRIRALSPDGKVIEEGRVTKLFKRRGHDTVPEKIEWLMAYIDFRSSWRKPCQEIWLVSPVSVAPQ